MILEEKGETTPGPIVEVTEGPQEKDFESPNGESHIGLWLLAGLILSSIICLGVGIKKAYYFCKKAYNFGLDERCLFNLILFFLNDSYFQIKGVNLNLCSPQ